MAKHTLPECRRTELCGWLTANGINPHDVPADADMTIDKGPTGRFLRCEVFDRSLDGRLQVDERGERVAVMVVNVPLQVEPPEWWAPYVKPTREQLLAVVERVRALHHDWESDPGHCAHCTGPDGNLVPFPCPTIRALDQKEPADA